MAIFTLTTGPDTFVGGPEDDTVNGTAATLNPGDRLTGGGGNDVVVLYGSGTFRVDQLAAFSGFSNITLNNYTNGTATLYLGTQPITVTGQGSGSETLYLGSGQTTYNGGSGSNYVYSFSNSNWNSADVINGGGNYGVVVLNDNYNVSVSYDLTGNTFQNINYLYGAGNNLTLKINSSDAAGVSNFTGWGANDQLVTSDSTLDLSHTDVSNFAILSTDATGTTFTVKDVATAFAIAGGLGRTPSLPTALHSPRISATPSSPPPRSRRSSTPAEHIRWLGRRTQLLRRP